MIRQALKTLVIPLLLSPSQANSQYDEPLSQRAARTALESCMYLRAYRSIIEEKSIDEFIDIVLQECEDEVETFNNASPYTQCELSAKQPRSCATVSDFYINEFLPDYERDLAKHKEMYQRRDGSK